MKATTIVYLAVFPLLLLPLLAIAHEEDRVDGRYDNNDNDHYDGALALKQRSFNIAVGVTFYLVIITLVLLRYGKLFTSRQKWAFYLAIAVPVALVTLYAAGTTIYLNLTSHTAGPVHWHADFEIWNCGKQIDLRDPRGASNRIGTSTFHEHGDNRIHVEGVVVKLPDASLHRFFEVVGGKLAEEELRVPTNEGFVSVGKGDFCENGEGDEEGKVQVFVYQTEGETYQQRKITDEYVLSPQALVPPGDCLIIEFDREKEHTDKLCLSYQRAIERGELHGR
ncbi:MAG: hypothetical protein AABX13_05920 [Nanoarchaeota archaeon]